MNLDDEVSSEMTCASRNVVNVLLGRPSFPPVGQERLGMLAMNKKPARDCGRSPRVEAIGLSSTLGLNFDQRLGFCLRSQRK